MVSMLVISVPSGAADPAAASRDPAKECNPRRKTVGRPVRSSPSPNGTKEMLQCGSRTNDTRFSGKPLVLEGVLLCRDISQHFLVSQQTQPTDPETAPESLR
jgi:hypothetical protein